MFHILRPTFPLSGRAQRSLAPAAVIALVLIASACSSGGPDEVATTDAVAASSSVDEIRLALFGSGDEPTEAQIKDQQAQSASYEDRVARCMVAAGFEYYPTSLDITTYQADQPDYMSREYAEEFGFGYTTTMDDPMQWNNDQPLDANQEYVSTLSPSEQEQYYVALYGDQSFWDDISSDEERIALEQEQPELFQPSGCNADANSAESKITNEFWTTHSDELNELFQAAEGHQLVQGPLKAWQVCMAEHGHTFTTPDDFDSVMEPYQNRLSESAVYPGSGLTEEEMSAMTEGELNALWSQPPQFDQELLAEAQAYEIELAVTSWDCGLEDLYSAYQDALQDLQQKYIESNLAELSALVTQ